MRVLVADDSPVMLSAMMRLLGQDPCVEISGTAANGREAFEQFLKLTPDIVILDFSMPEMNGFEAARKIHSVTSEVPLVICGLDVSPQLDEKAKQEGVCLLSKSDLGTDLLKTLRGLLNAKGLRTKT